MRGECINANQAKNTKVKARQKQEKKSDNKTHNAFCILPSYFCRPFKSRECTIVKIQSYEKIRCVRFLHFCGLKKKETTRVKSAAIQLI
jgi:hypothetical protein